MTYDKIYNLDEIAYRYQVVLFDIWGVLIDARVLNEGAVDRINRIIAQKDVRFVTNAPRLAATTAQRLRDAGFCVQDHHVITSGDILRRYIRDYKGTIYHLGSDRNTEILAGLKLYLTKKIEEADLLLLTLSRYGHEDLTGVLNFLKYAAKLNIKAVCPNPDHELHLADRMKYCAGYFAAYYTKLGGHVLYIGKPEYNIFQEVFFEFASVPKSNFLIVGDTLHTDIQGAYNTGIDSALVLTGNMHQAIKGIPDWGFASAVESACQKYGVYPTYLVQI